VFLVPVFGSRSLPSSLKGGISLVIALVLFPVVRAAAPFSNLIILILAISREIFIGITIGLFIRLIFAGVQVACQVIGFQMGLNMINSISPMEQEDVSTISQFGTLLAMLIFLGIDAHHWLFRALAKSFDLIPLGTAHLSASLFEKIMGQASDMFVIAVKIGAPVMISLLILKMVLGVLAKTVPQMNVFIVAFPIQIAVGLLILALSLPSIAYLIKALFEGMGMDILNVLRSML